MLTRIEIDGFKSFAGFSLDLQPFTAIVGPNASGKSNLFDALKFLSLLVRGDIRAAMHGIRGEPEELFRQTAAGRSDHMAFAVEVLLDPHGTDGFGTRFDVSSRRLRYELEIRLDAGAKGDPPRVHVARETCEPIRRSDDRHPVLKGIAKLHGARQSGFIEMNPARDGILIRQDGPEKRGKAVSLALKDASQTGLSTITTAEFPHLFALKALLVGIRFLEINPSAARAASDRLAQRDLLPDASNLAAVMAHLKAETKTEDNPNGILADIARDLSWLIPSIQDLEVHDDAMQREYTFGLRLDSKLSFSSRVISDGTLRLLALLTVLHDPRRRGTLCFEEPENGIHEGRVPDLVTLLRGATGIPGDKDAPSFQIVVNSHSPAVMASLNDPEIVVADSVIDVDPDAGTRATRTRMRTDVKPIDDLIDPERHLTRFEVERLLRRRIDAA